MSGKNPITAQDAQRVASAPSAPYPPQKSSLDTLEQHQDSVVGSFLGGRRENGESDGLGAKAMHPHLQQQLLSSIGMEAEGEGVKPQGTTHPNKGSIDSPSKSNNNKSFDNRIDNKKTSNKKPRTLKQQQRQLKRGQQQPEKSNSVWRSRRNWKKRSGEQSLVRVALVDNEEEGHSVGPIHQYRVTLKRRAIHKREEPSSKSHLQQQPQQQQQQQRRGIFSVPSEDSTRSKNESSEDDDVEEYGDVTLGMKLVILGGKVIVQHLNALSDGRASPAQLAGVIHRGDVLLSIDNVSLVKLKIDSLADALRPLSSPDAATGAYKRKLNLCFAAGEGVKLLTKSESSASKIAALAAKADTAGSDVFSLFPMVDQLSGMPLFEDIAQSASDLMRVTSSDQSVVEADQISSIEPLQPSEESDVGEHSFAVDQVISRCLADQRLFDRAKYTSAYYSWNTLFSELLRPSQASVVAPPRHKRQTANKVTRAEILQQGMKALFGASKLTIHLGNIDRGKDMRSFKHWNTSLSLRSRASSRRKFLLEVTSLPAGMRIEKVGEAHPDDDSIVTTASEEYDGLDPDELLLRLAAHDDIWRKQVVTTLGDAVREMEEDHEEADEEKENAVAEGLPVPDIDAAISKELGSFLFGEQMAKIVSKRKKTFVLPPSDVTSVLFDLVTQLATTRPDEVAVIGGSTVSMHALLLPVPNPNNFNKTDVKVVLATEFVLSHALPVWLKSFRPLPWEQRRVLWPYVQQTTSDTHTSASMTHHSDDSLTVDSGLTASPNSSPRQRRNLREVIEDMELDVEARAEVCFLVSFYFTEALLPKLKNQSSDGRDGSHIDIIMDFISSYGAYLQLHTCLAYAAVIEADEVIQNLLDLAKHDPRHLEGMKQLSKSNALLLYEPSMLSAIVQRVRAIRHDKRADIRRSIAGLAAAAFPDARPWQLRKAFLSDADEHETKDDGDLRELYYYYLSNLLHPLQGNAKARHDPGLVEEWCRLSVDFFKDGVKSEKRRENFFAVASRSSSNHLVYHRDLVLLLNLSMQVNESNLALDLIGEILDNSKYAMSSDVLQSVVEHLRALVRSAIDSELGCTDPPGSVPKLLTRIMRLFHKMAKHKSHIVRESVSVSMELFHLVEYSSKSGKDMDLISFLAANADPVDILQTMNLLTLSSQNKPDRMLVFSTLHLVLRRASVAGIGMELSSALLRIRQARVRTTDAPPSISGFDDTSKQSIWRQMYDGEARIDK